jgi:hypothetical protein
VAFADETIVTISTRNCFFTSPTGQYFEPDKLFDKFYHITNFAEAVVNTVNGKRRIITTRRIPAGTRLRIDGYRVKLKSGEVTEIESRFKAFVHANLCALMGRGENESKIIFEPQYSATLIFVGAVAASLTEKNSIIKTVMAYNPFHPECLEDQLKSNVTDYLWLEFWRRELAHKFTAEQVYHIWHTVINFVWSSPDQLSLVFSKMICFTECHPLRMAEYKKVMDGQQNADEDKYTDRFLSDYIMTQSRCVNGFDDGIYAHFVKDIEPDQTIYRDFGPACISNPCDTVLGFLFMNDRKDGKQFHDLYKNIMLHFGEPVINSYLDYMKKNFHPTMQTIHVNRTQATGVCTTPRMRASCVSVPTGMPPALPTCYCCAKPMEHPLYCARCKIAAYCGKICQTADWKLGHKDNCMPQSWQTTEQFEDAFAALSLSEQKKAPPALPTLPTLPTLPICSYCAKPMEHPKKHPKYCGICRIAQYCDRNCQKADWNKAGQAGHKANCIPR